jgi:hypothetical protein
LHAKNEKGVSAAVFHNFSGSFSPSSGIGHVFAFRTIRHDHLRTFVTAPFNALFHSPLVRIGHVFAFRTICHDYLRTFVTAPFDAPFLRPEPPQRMNKLTKFCLLTDIKQLVQKYSISSARVALFFFALLFLLRRPVKTILPHAMQASQCGQRREGRMSFINVYRKIILFRHKMEEANL